MSSTPTPKRATISAAILGPMPLIKPEDKYPSTPSTVRGTISRHCSVWTDNRVYCFAIHHPSQSEQHPFGAVHSLRPQNESDGPYIVWQNAPGPEYSDLPSLRWWRSIYWWIIKYGSINKCQYSSFPKPPFVPCYRFLFCAVLFHIHFREIFRPLRIRMSSHKNVWIPILKQIAHRYQDIAVSDATDYPCQSLASEPDYK